MMENIDKAFSGRENPGSQRGPQNSNNRENPARNDSSELSHNRDDFSQPEDYLDNERYMGSAWHSYGDADAGSHGGSPDRNSEDSESHHTAATNDTGRSQRTNADVDPLNSDWDKLSL
jgi:hypothetical protein